MSEPLAMILTALASGAAAVAKDTGGAAVKDTYNGLKSLIKKKFGGNAMAEGTLDQHAEDAETWEKPLQKALASEGADSDNAILEAAQKLMDQLSGERQPGQTNITIKNSPGAMGQVTGNVTQNFGK